MLSQEQINRYHRQFYVSASIANIIDERTIVVSDRGMVITCLWDGNNWVEEGEQSILADYRNMYDNMTDAELSA